jgi:hypothetical protein
MEVRKLKGYQTLQINKSSDIYLSADNIHECCVTSGTFSWVACLHRSGWRTCMGLEIFLRRWGTGWTGEACNCRALCSL